MNIAGLDLSLTGTGVCLNGHVRTIKSKLKDEARLQYIWEEIETLVCHASPELVIIEGLAYGTVTGKAMERAGLFHIVRIELWRRGIPFALCPPSVVKKYVTGKGNAGKDEVMIAAVKLFAGINITNNNEADAATLFAIAKDHFGEPIVTVPAVNRSTLDKTVDWEIGAQK